MLLQFYALLISGRVLPRIETDPVRRCGTLASIIVRTELNWNLRAVGWVLVQPASVLRAAVTSRSGGLATACKREHRGGCSGKHTNLEATNQCLCIRATESRNLGIHPQTINVTPSHLSNSRHRPWTLQWNGSCPHLGFSAVVLAMPCEVAMWRLWPSEGCKAAIRRPAH